LIEECNLIQVDNLDADRWLLIIGHYDLVNTQTIATFEITSGTTVSGRNLRL